MKSFGFTLIELLWSIAIASALSSVGIAAFFTYSRQQALQSAVSDFTTMLQVAKSRAQTQVKPDSGDCSTRSLIGYKVTITIDQIAHKYRLWIECSDNNIQPIDNQENTLPNGIKFCNMLPNNVSNTEFSFGVLTGVVSGLGSVDIFGNGIKKTVSVSPSGVIQVKDAQGQCPA